MADRKTFLKQAGALAALGCCTGISVFFEGCKTTSKVPHRIENNELILSKPALDATQGNMAVIRDDQFAAPLCVAKKQDGSYGAVVMICTHKACELDSGGGILICPCHGSEFKPTGEVTKGPATDNLGSLVVSVRGEEIVIHLPSQQG